MEHTCRLWFCSSNSGEMKIPPRTCFSGSTCAFWFVAVTAERWKSPPALAFRKLSQKLLIKRLFYYIIICKSGLVCLVTNVTLRGQLWYFPRRVWHRPWLYLNAELHLNQYRCRCNCLARQQLIGHEASPPSDQAIKALELTWGTVGHQQVQARSGGLGLFYSCRGDKNTNNK